MNRSHLKYGNKKIVIDGIKFDSKKEARRYGELKRLEKAGQIKDLILQPRFEICPRIGHYRARHYVADFQYIDCATLETFVEDVKSEITRKNQLYTLKRQLFINQYGKDYVFKET